jgi:dipeptidyl aminopeptidase/acylaminoacyl peptidase
VVVPGGAWARGKRQELAIPGVETIAIDLTVAPHPRPLDDIVAALRRHPQAAALGLSSGAHQLLLVALLGLAPVERIVAAYPVADPLARFAYARERGMHRLVAAHEAYFTDTGQMAAASPQLIVEAGEAQALPPLLLLQGGADENLPPGASQRFAEAYARAGGDVRLEVFPGQPHGFLARDARALALVADFVSRPRPAASAAG